MTHLRTLGGPAPGLVRSGRYASGTGKLLKSVNFGGRDAPSVLERKRLFRCDGQAAFADHRLLQCVRCRPR